MLRDGAVLLVIRLRHVPDPVAQRKEGLALCLDDIPDGFGVFHGFQNDFDSHSIQNWRQFRIQNFSAQSVCMNKFWTFF